MEKKKKYKYNHDPECLKKCGNTTTHKSGVCGKCRTVTCKTCSHVFTYKDLPQKECAECRNTRRNSAEYKEFLSVADALSR